MHQRRTVSLAVMFGLLAVSLMVSPRSWAADTERGEKWQFSIPINFLPSTTFDGEGGSTADIHDDLGWGFGFGYNYNDKFYLGGEFTWLSANYDLNLKSADTSPVADQTLAGTLDAASINFKGQYNFMSTTVTPFVGANIGWTYIDSNIPSGPTQGTCWWDPWWGYICNTWQPTYDDSVFSYGANVGVRAELSESFFLEGSYRIMWLDTPGDTLDFDGFRLELGWMN